ncbi:hypothetical protein [Rubellimicrobium roseum]|uniref:hypothetical protein n=1 Tax=Rubellimicrobium roseum TaxID=687525 RepID=UPI00159BDEE5|nr:hypothetical protein [Rubellimicrobium roseum]
MGIAQVAMHQRSDELPKQIAPVKRTKRIADLGGAAVVEVTTQGVPEPEVALRSTASML